ncbi:MAG: phage tail tape measure protein, partial [Gemmatimonadaceae bacterium]
VTAASGQAFSVDTTAALGDLDRIGAAAQGAGITVRSASGSVFAVDTSAALGDLAKVSGAAQDASSAIAGAGGTIDVDSRQIKDAEAAATGLRGSLGRFSGSIELAGVNVFADAAAAASELRSSMGRFSGTIELSGIGTIKAAQAAAQDLSATLGSLSGGSVDFSGAAAQLRSMAADAQSVSSSLGAASGASLGGGGGGGGGAFGGLASVLPTAAIAGGLGAGLKTGWDNAIGLEQELTNVRATLGDVSNADMGRLSQSIITIGVNSQYSGVEVAGISEELAKAGYGIEQQLNGNMLQGVVNLASATGTALPTAITAVVQAMAIWSPGIVDNTIAMTDSAKAADILTVAANASSADVNDIIAGVRNLGPIAAQMHVPFEQVAGAVAMFTNYGLKGADAGVSLARGLQNLNDPTSQASQLMGELGINVFDAQGSFVGFPTLFDSLHTSMAGMTDQQKLTNIGILFGAEAQDVFTQAIAAGKDPLVEIIKLMDHHGLAAEQAAKRQDTLNFALQRFTEGLGTSLGSLFTPLLGPAKEAINVIANLISSISQLAAPIRAVLGLALSLGAAFSGFKALSAIKGIFGLLTGGGAAAGAGAGEAAAGAGLLSTALPILAGVAVVAGAGFLAYKTNFMGFGDLVDNATCGAKKFYNVLTGANPKVDQLNKTQRAWVDGLRASGQPQEVVDNYLRAQGVSAEYAQKKYDLLTKTQRAWVDGLRASGQPQSVIDGYLRAQGVSAEYTTSKYQKLRNDGMSPLIARSTMLADAFDAIGWSTLADGTRGAIAGVQRLTAGFTLGRTLGMDPFHAGLLGLGMAIPALTPLLNVVSESVGHVTDAFGSFVAGDYAQGFKDLGSAAQTIGSSLGNLAVSIGGWVISSTADLGSAIFDWVQNTAIPNIGNAASTVYGILVSIGSWAKGTIADLAPTVKEWATSAMSTATEAAGTIWNVVVNIGSWAKGIVSDLWPYITMWTSSLMSGVSSAAGTLWGVIVNIGSWAKGTISDLWPYMTQWTSSLLSGVSSAAGTLWGVIVNIGSWAKGTISDLWPYTTQWTSSLLSGVSSAAGTIWNVIVNVGSWAQGIVS